MATVAPKFETVEQVVRFIPDNDFNWYDSLDESEIRGGHVCLCDKSKFGDSDDSRIYTLDKTGVAQCHECEGYYGILLHNW